MSFLSKLAAGLLGDKKTVKKVADSGLLGIAPQNISQSQQSSAVNPQYYGSNYQNPMQNKVAPTPQMTMPMQQQPAFNPQQQAAMNTMRFGGNRPQQQYTPPQMMQPPIMPSQMPQNMNMAQNPNQMASPAMSGAPWNVQRRFT